MNCIIFIFMCSWVVALWNYQIIIYNRQWLLFIETRCLYVVSFVLFFCFFLQLMMTWVCILLFLGLAYPRWCVTWWWAWFCSMKTWCSSILMTYAFMVCFGIAFGLHFIFFFNIKWLNYWILTAGWLTHLRQHAMVHGLTLWAWIKPRPSQCQLWLVVP